MPLVWSHFIAAVGTRMVFCLIFWRNEIHQKSSCLCHGGYSCSSFSCCPFVLSTPESRCLVISGVLWSLGLLNFGLLTPLDLNKRSSYCIPVCVVHHGVNTYIVCQPLGPLNFGLPASLDFNKEVLIASHMRRASRSSLLISTGRPWHIHMCILARIWEVSRKLIKYICREDCRSELTSTNSQISWII